MNDGEDGVSASAAAAPLDWKFSQVFGERTSDEEVQESNFVFFFSFSIQISFSHIVRRSNQVIREKKLDKEYSKHKEDKSSGT